MKNLEKYLPCDWQTKAKELKAMERESGVIRTAESLLRLNMLYITNGGSFQMAATGMALTEGIKLSKTAAHKRIRKSGPWLRDMAEKLCKNEGQAIPKPSFLGEREVVLVDASDESVKGGKQSDYRLHFAFELFNFKAKCMDLTGAKEGEKLGRYAFSKHEIVVADRIYCTMSGIEHVRAQESGFVLRFKSKAFNLYDETGERLNILSLIRHLKALENTEIRCFYRLSSGEMRPLRLVAMKKTAKAIDETKRKMNRKVNRKQEKPVQPDTAELNEYVVLATNLDYTNEQILELYRARWQIEQVFFRLKSLFGYGDTPSKCDDTVQAWFYGKLLLAALCECILKRESFSPELEPIICDIVGAQFMG